MTDGCTVTADAVLFDLDGVLVDSTAAVEDHWRDFAARHDLPVDELLVGLHGRRMIEIMAGAAPHLSPAALRDEADRMERIEAEGARAGTRAQPGSLALVAALAGRPWAIATSGTRPVALARIEAVGLPDPPVLVTGEDVAHGKPDPAPYLLAARRLGVDPVRCVVVEDAPSGVRAARVAGCTVIAVTTSHAPDELAEADHRVTTPADLTLVAAHAAGTDRVTLAVACRAHRR